MTEYTKFCVVSCYLHIHECDFFITPLIGAHKLEINLCGVWLAQRLFQSPKMSAEIHNGPLEIPQCFIGISKEDTKAGSSKLQPRGVNISAFRCFYKANLQFFTGHTRLLYQAKILLWDLQILPHNFSTVGRNPPRQCSASETPAKQGLLSDSSRQAEERRGGGI